MKHANDYDLPVWEHPSNYGGFSPDGDFYLISRHRDSSPLDESNYRVMWRELQRVAKTLPEPTNEGEHGQGAAWVYDFRAGHWAVGWIEHMLIRRDAPDKLQREAYEMLGALADYPVLDESDLSEMESDQISEWWDRMDTSERIEWCVQNETSIFAARRDYPVDQVYDDMRESLYS